MKEHMKINSILTIWSKQLRVHHWIKNVLVFAPLMFSGKFFQMSEVSRAVEFFMAFNFLASSIYVFNDVIDLKRDQAHPKKKFRPVAAGLISVPAAITVGFLLALTALALGFASGLSVFLVLLVYLVNNVFYNLYLKHKVLADVMSISIGFMCRFIGGAFAIAVEPSRWLLVCGFTLSLFLAFGKRRTEVELVSSSLAGADIRPTLDVYDKEKLNTALSVMNAVCVMSYILFVTDPETVLRHKSNQLLYTVPIVIYGLFRYMYKTQEGRGTGPVDIIFKDKAFILAIMAWSVLTLMVLY